MGDFLHSFFDIHQILHVLPTLLGEGLRNTLIIASLSLLLGLTAGLLLSMLLIATRWWLRAPARIYVDIFRGLPAIVTVSIIGIGLPSADIRPFGESPMGYAILAIGLINAAYIAEIFRSGIQSVPVGQMEAGRSLGMSHLTTLMLIVVPQGIRNVLPALANQFIIAVKESSLVYLLGLAVGERELYFIAQQAQAVSYNSSSFVAAGLVYIAFTVPLTHLVNRFDRRMREGKRPTVADEPVGKEPLTPVGAGMEAGA
ncbi:amino acid ABC transporter permease [Streptomyces sulfonofaciens]|uniref:Amino acid ABC transporter permease n=1 Tax=Streptomyces sulfonofaciens TaxID=68272 RepID=A0A919KS89_9ACTN|nr:amino acid ABC transporter permease [Streptomyces sulfonofaciens]GHH71305.1 amino acid ABC transporter permease [Streptomyces sulfonofaciens]